MASITKKIIRGHAYYYVRECKRVDGRPKIVWQKYLGRLDDIIAAVTAWREGRPLPQPEGEGTITELGAVAALYDLSERLDLAGTIDRHLPKRGPGPSVGTYLEVAVLNRCVAPTSKAKIGQWFGDTVLRRLLPIEPRQLTSQRFWDNMSRVSPQAIESIEAELTGRLVKTWNLDLSRLLFDGTNFFTFIDTFNERCSLAQRGKSKEGRASLRLVGLALLVTADFQVPLLHHTYPGNHNDVSTFASLTDRLVTRCKELADGVEQITIIFDKGNNSADNVGALDESPYHFVGSLVPTHHRDLLPLPRDELRSLADEGFPGVRAYRTTRKVFGQKRTVLLTYNDELFVAQSKTLLRLVGNAQRGLEQIAARLGRWHRGEVRRGRPPTRKGTRNRVKECLKPKHLKELFDVDLTERDGLPALTYRFNHEEWERLQGTLLGKTILFTDNHGWTDAEILSAYRGQYHVERAFRRMKDPQHIALRPQYHWTDQKIRVHVFTCVLALTLLSLLRRDLHHRGFPLSIPRMVDLLSGIREMVMFFPGEGKRPQLQARIALSKMSPEQRDLFDALDLGRYTSV